MAASYLKQEVPVIETNVPPPSQVAVVEPVPPTATTVAEPQPVPPPNPIPATPETTVPAVPAAAATTPAPETPAPTVTSSQPVPEMDTNLPPPPPRVVTHEGSVRPSVSLVAPTYFELYDPESGNAINYLYSTTTNLNLSRYNGMHITVTGQEGLDARWKDTPVLTIQKIYVLSTNPPPKLKRVDSPRASQRH